MIAILSISSSIEGWSAAAHDFGDGVGRLEPNTLNLAIPGKRSFGIGTKRMHACFDDYSQRPFGPHHETFQGISEAATRVLDPNER